MHIYKQLKQMYGAQKAWWPGETPFHIAIGAILTQNTTWTSAYKALQNLICQNLDTPQALYNTDIENIKSLIKPAGFMNQKAGYLKNLAIFTCEHLDCCIRNLKKLSHPREALLSVKGIGKETADSILLYALDMPYFVVDAYTRRIFSRLSLVNEKEPYDNIAQTFMSALPQDAELYKEYHALIVEHAKRRCKKKSPLCEGCLLKDLCLLQTTEDPYRQDI
ncbi:endonuclease [bacterium 3DAC]|nr:endonuclease [Dictyoglomota bacterium]UZN23777.1 endonuclease [bacterium 3DAC]